MNIMIFMFIIQSAHFESLHYCKITFIFESDSNIQSNSVCVSTFLGQLGYYLIECLDREIIHTKWASSREKKCKWVWSGNTTITNCRQPCGTAKKSRSTITRHQEDKLSKAISSLFPIKPCFRRVAKNTGADQPTHPHRLISAFVIRFLESIISKLATSELSIL